MDRITSMRVFVKAVETGSFSAAAQALQLSAQLVGKHVNHLELRLGLRLLNRTTRRQSLTDFGKQFYDQSKIILAEIETVEKLAAQTHSKPSGRLRISAPVSFGTHVLARRLPEFLQANPLVKVELSLSNHAVDLIDEGYDVVFKSGPPPHSALMAHPLAPCRMVLCAAPAYVRNNPPITTPWDLQDHECLERAHSEPRTQWLFEGPKGAISVPVNGQLMVDHDEPLLQAALAGMGVMLQPLALLETYLQDGQLIRLLPEFPVPDCPLHLLYAPDHRLTPKLQQFLDFALQAFAADTSPDQVNASVTRVEQHLT